MSENWHEERDRIVKLLKALESGAITHIDEGSTGQLTVANAENVAALKARLSILNGRIGKG